MSSTSPLARLRSWLAQDVRGTAVVGTDQVAQATRRHGRLVGALVAVKVWVIDTFGATNPYGPSKHSPSYMPMPESGTKDLYAKQGWQPGKKA